jgi:hypothetical protein
MPVRPVQPVQPVGAPVQLDQTGPQAVLEPPTPVEPPVEPSADPMPYIAPANSSNGHRPVDRVAAWHGSPEPWLPAEPSQNGNGNGRAGSRTARRDRTPIQAVFAELLDLAAIPQTAYAVDDEVPGAMCLVKVDDGFEVFASSEEARLEVRFFEDEEAAYFYLFGVLAAEAVRNGDLGPRELGCPTRPETFQSTYEHEIHPIPCLVRLRFVIAGGADGPPLPKQPRRPPKRKCVKDVVYHETCFSPFDNCIRIYAQ